MKMLQTIALKKYYDGEPNITRALDGDTAEQKFMNEIVKMLALEDKLRNMSNNLSGGRQGCGIGGGRS